MLLIKPYLGCNIACKYCYEGNLRKKHRPKMKYNLKAIFKRMESFKDLHMALHGGEILTLPKKDIKALLGKMYELRGRSTIQTNATLIDDEYIEMFKKYKTNIGISWDGPGELSAYRPGTSKVEGIMKRLIKKGVGVSTIIVISKANTGTPRLLNKLKKYLLELDQMKVHGRLNPCHNAPEYELSMKRMKEVYLDLADFCLRHNLKWSPFKDIIDGLQGKDRVCVFRDCDPFFTQSAMVILGDGSITNCMRTNQEGILLRDSVQSKTRNEILENVPQEYSGCKDCKYWTACFGGCPSGAIDNDWRNRTYLCPVWKALFEFYENILSYCGFYPVSQKPAPSKKSEKPPKEELTEVKPGWEHGDHTDSRPGAPHGDSPHGDSLHGDHVDKKSTEIEPDVPRKDLPHGDSPHGDHSDHKDCDHSDHEDSKSL